MSDLGAGRRPRRRYGSGLLLGRRQVLTAAHVVSDARLVVVRGPDKAEKKACLKSSLIGDSYGRDLALLEVPEAEDLSSVPVGVVDQETSSGQFVERCWAVGYPVFQEVTRESGDVVRDTAHVGGRIPTLSGLVEGLLSLQVTNTPRELPEGGPLGDSEWSGMSGAAVFSDESLIGVVTEHARRRGSSEVMVAPLYRRADEATGQTDPAEWWARLGVRDPETLPKLPTPLSRPEPAYWWTMREIRGRTRVLVGRERELGEIGDFASGDDEAFGPGSTAAGYLRLVGEPWAGKTALLAEAAHTLPSDIDVVAYFIIGRDSKASREEFIAAVVPQLAYLLEENSPLTTGADTFKDLWARAANHAEDRGRHLLLVVDGLDEDVGLGEHSVAAVLPTPALGARARVLVTSRPDMPLPNDLDIHHPLQTAARIRLSATQETRQLRRLAEQEIRALLPRDIVETPTSKLTLDILGMLTAAAGPLTVHDLAELTGFNSLGIRNYVTEQAARSLQPVGPQRERGYQFAHQTLLEYCRDHPCVGSEPNYLRRLLAWADNWRAKGWGVADSGTGPRPPRYLLDYLPALLERAGRSQQLHDLLGQQRCSGLRCLNVWYAAKMTAGLLEGYMADLERARRLAIADRDVHMQARYALYMSSLRGTNVRVPARLLELCLEERVITSQEAIDSARLNRDPIRRVRAVSSLARILPPEERQRVVDAEFAVVLGLDEEQRASAFLALAGVLPDRLLTVVMQAADAIRSDRYSSEIVAAVATRLSEGDLKTALKIVSSVRDPILKVTSLSALASRPVDCQRLQPLAEIRRLIARMPPTAAKVTALCTLARLEPDPKRQEETVDQALAVAKALDYSEGLTIALTALARLGAPLVSAERVTEMVELAERTYRDEDHPGTYQAYIATLATLGPILSDEQRASFIGRLVATLQAASNWFMKGMAHDYVPLLAPYLSKDEQPAAFGKYISSLVATGAHARTPRAMPEEWSSRAALAALEQLPQDLVEPALEAAAKVQADVPWQDEIELDEGRADVLATLVPRLPPERRVAILHREVDRVRGINDEYAQAYALAALLPHSPEQTRAALVEATLKTCQAMGRHQGYFKVVASLTAHLPPDRTATLLNQALDAARANEDTRSRAKALAAVIPSLPEAKIPEALEGTETLGDSSYLALAPLVPRLPVKRRQDAISRVLQAVRGVVIGELPEDFVDVLRPICSYLNDPQVVTALDLTGEISPHNASLQADALAILAPRLRRKQQDRAISMANDLQDDLSYIRAVASLARSLKGPQRAAWLRKAKEATNRLHDNEARMRALVAIAPLLAEPPIALSEALQVAIAIERDDRRAHALSSLLAHLEGAERLTAFEEMLQSCLGFRVARTVGSHVVLEGLDRAFLLERIADAAGVLAAIGGERIAADTARTICETATAWP